MTHRYRVRWQTVASAGLAYYSGTLKINAESDHDAETQAKRRLRQDFPAHKLKIVSVYRQC